jgi:hypothetical protein
MGRQTGGKQCMPFDAKKGKLLEGKIVLEFMQSATPGSNPGRF